MINFSNVPFDIQLWVGRPIRILLEAFPNLIIGQNVKKAERGVLVFQNLNYLFAETFFMVHNNRGSEEFKTKAKMRNAAKK